VWSGIAAVFGCFLPVLFGFLIPAGYLLASAMERIAEFGIPPDFFSWVATTLGFAAAATLIAILLGLLLAYSARTVRHPLARLLVRFALLGYALPGTVLAVGLLVPLAAFDNALDSWMGALFGISTGLLIVGSGAALVLAYVLRFLAVSVGGIDSGLSKISPSLDAAARSLGSRQIEVVRRIHAPLLAPAVAAAGLLVFVDCAKELPATLLLRPFNFESLATQLYGEAVRGTYEAGAVSALAIVMIGVVPMLLVGRTGRGFRTAASPRISPAPDPASTADQP
jgi:iron(III) transport system permease protein